MARFSSAQKQAGKLVRAASAIGVARHGNSGDRRIHSLGTSRNYSAAIEDAIEWMKENGHLDGIGGMTMNLARAYLEEKAEVVRQSTLDQKRQALQVLKQFRHRIIPRIRSTIATIKKGRSYTPAQIERVAQGQTAHNRVATHIAWAAGLRAHELWTIRRESEQPASNHRHWHGARFSAEGWIAHIYTVKGKGGLTREVALPPHLADELQRRRLKEPRIVIDRGIKYEQHYEIGGGHSWSESFSSASKRTLGWSTGAHGVRHSYAQNRMEQLQKAGKGFREALLIVSQEMGHYRPEITLEYLR